MSMVNRITVKGVRKAIKAVEETLPEAVYAVEYLRDCVSHMAYVTQDERLSELSDKFYRIYADLFDLGGELVEVTEELEEEIKKYPPHKKFVK